MAPGNTPNHADTGPPKPSPKPPPGQTNLHVDMSIDVDIQKCIIVKLQTKVPTDDLAKSLSTDASVSSTQRNITSQIVNFASTIILVNKMHTIRLCSMDDRLLDLNSLSNKNDYELQKDVKIINKPRSHRNVEIWLKLETTATFAQLKRPLFEWLKNKNWWLDHHCFDTTVTRTKRIGYLFFLAPQDLHREGLQDAINLFITSNLSALSPTARLAYYKQFDPDTRDTTRSFPKARVLYANNVQHSKDNEPEPTVTTAIVIETAFDDRSLMDDLMQQLTNTKHIFGKYVPISIAQDPNTLTQFRQLAEGQNAVINNHYAIPIVGIDKEQMCTRLPASKLNPIRQHYHPDTQALLVPPGKSLREHLKNLDGVIRVEQTGATRTMGKWYLITSQEKSKQLETTMDNNLALLFQAQGYASTFTRYPEPRRLRPAPKVPLAYINTITAAANEAVTQYKGDKQSLRKGPNTNAWLKRPSSTSTNDSTSTVSDNHQFSVSAPTTNTTQSEIDVMNKKLQALEATQREIISKLDHSLNARSPGQSNKTPDLTADLEARVQNITEQHSKVLDQQGQILRRLENFAKPAPPFNPETITNTIVQTVLTQLTTIIQSEIKKHMYPAPGPTPQYFPMPPQVPPPIQHQTGIPPSMGLPPFAPPPIHQYPQQHHVNQENHQPQVPRYTAPVYHTPTRTHSPVATYTHIQPNVTTVPTPIQNKPSNTQNSNTDQNDLDGLCTQPPAPLHPQETSKNKQRTPPRSSPGRSPVHKKTDPLNRTQSTIMTDVQDHDRHNPPQLH